MGDIERKDTLFRRRWASRWSGRSMLRREIESDSGAKGPQIHVVAMGHSHLLALVEAQASRVAAGRSFEGSIEFIQLLEPAFNPNIDYVNGRVVLKAALAERLQKCSAVPNGCVPMIVDCIGGNEYHLIGLTNHPRPFDFVLPAAPKLPLLPGAEIIPTTLIIQTMRSSMQYVLAVFTALREATGLPIWHVQSPPPISSDAYILAHATYFKDVINMHGVMPALLRWKLWRLQSDVYLEACESLGIAFLPTPPEALDQQGFLVEAGWNQDPTHANGWFGELILSQIAEVCKQVRAAA
jgi:hypothetical protein